VLPLGRDATEYRRLPLPAGRTVEAAGRTFLEIEPATLTALVREAVSDISHHLRPAHLAQLRAIVDDPEASPNDRFVARTCCAGPRWSCTPRSSRRRAGRW
jgi:fumarate hydratase class I